MGFSQELLMENRLPSLYTKYSGTKTVPTENIPAHKILTGSKPKVRTKNKLDTTHDLLWSRGFGNAPEFNDAENAKSDSEKYIQAKTKHIVDKIAEVDPTTSKEYTDRMLQWYSNSSNHQKGTGVHQDTYGYPTGTHQGSAHSNMTAALSSHAENLPGWENPEKQEAYVQKGLQIHRQQREAKVKEHEEKHSSHPEFHFRSEDFGRAKEALEIFHRVKQQLPPEHRDINKINSLHHLEDIIEPHRFRVSGNEADRRIKEEGTTLLHDDPELAVYHVKTPEASCALGAGTRWCVSGHHDNMFENYDKTSPMIMFHDKTGKLAHRVSQLNGRRREPISQNRRFMFHFGEQRHATHVSTDEDEIGHEPHQTETDHQLMDERDHAFDYHEFVGAFPQAKKIPALQHLHATLFQDKPLSERKEQAKTPEGFDKILKHMEKYPEMQRGHLPKTQYLTSLLETTVSAQPHSPASHQITASENHPIIKHFIETANKDEQESFLKHLGESNHVLPTAAVNKFIQHGNIGVSAISKLANKSDDPSVHRMAYQRMKDSLPIHGNGFRDGDEYDFLRKTTDPKLLEFAHMDLKKSFMERARMREPINSNDNPKYYPRTSVHEHIAANPHTPEYILHDIIANKPLHGFHEKERDMSEISGRYSKYVTHSDRAGVVAMNNLLMREDAKKAKPKIGKMRL